MPGLCGFFALDQRMPLPELEPMVSTLAYKRASVIESYEDGEMALSCAHLGTGGQQALYQSSQVAVLFFGYLTRPSIPPGTDECDPASAAHHIHDHYLKRGEALLDDVRGAFAFALWDRRTQTLLLASDRLGLRPLYYAEHCGSLRFASEVKAILADPTFPHRLDRAALADFFHYSYPMGQKTFFEDIQLLPPASLLRCHSGRWEVTSYWDIAFPEHHPTHPDKWYDDLIYDALQAAVKRMVRPELHYGLALSGGMDSRWIAAFLAQVKPGSPAFTLGIPGSDDTLPAKEVAAQAGLHHHYWEVSHDFVAELAETHTYVVDGMYSLANIEESPLSVRVGDYVDVSVGGFLGDCLFGHEINPLSARLRKRDVQHYWLWRTKGDRLPEALMAQVFGQRTSQEFSTLAMDSLRNSLASATSDRGFQVFQYVNMRHRQRRFINAAQLAKLPYLDIYHPIADEEVVRAALQLPPNQLILERAYRRAMVTHFPDLAGIPWTFAMTPVGASVPTLVLKKAAQLTLGRWLRGTWLGNHSFIRPRRYFVDYVGPSRGSLRPFFEETLLSPDANATNLFHPDGLRTAIIDHMEGRQNLTDFLGKALAIALWTRLFYLPSTPIRPSGLDSDA
jgi:asparagine synthase (glutamine-hydrolysing)